MTDLVEKLLKKPPKIKYKEMTHIKPMDKKLVHQADTLFLTNNKGYKYLLVVGDEGGDRQMDVIPLKSKDSKAIAQAFKKIYSGSILKKPLNVRVDPGNEFKGEAEKYFKDNDINVITSKIGRHKSQSIVENRNKQIAEIIFKRQMREEFISGEENSEWIALLPKVIKTINKRSKENMVDVRKDFKKKIKKKREPKTLKFGLGQRVYVKLEQPKNVINDKTHSGNFRATDLRYDHQKRKIVNIITDPGSPVLYILNHPTKKGKIEHVGYSEKELIAAGDEDYGDVKDIVLKKKKLKSFIAERILDSKKVKGKTFYLVKWRGYPKTDTSWEPKKEFIKNEHHNDLIEEYDSEET